MPSKTPEVRFIHVADLHLGNRQYKLDERQQDFFDVFKEVMDYALSQDIKLILIPGDLAHHKDLTPEVLSNIELQLKIAKDSNITVIVTEGNHDKGHKIQNMSWLEYLNKKWLIRLLGSSRTTDSRWCIRNDGVEVGTVVGLRYYGASTKKVLDGFWDWLENSGTFMTAKNRILMLHAGVVGVIPNAGNIKPEDLLRFRKHFTYCALGHIHKPHEIEGFIFNPGSTESNSIAEGEFQGGFYDVTLSDGKIKYMKHIRTNKRPMIRMSSDKFTDDEIIFAPEERIKLEPYNDKYTKKSPIIEVTITGTHKDRPNSSTFSDVEQGPFSQHRPLIVRIVDKTRRPDQEILLDDVERDDIEKSVISQLVDGDVEMATLIRDIKDSPEEDAGITYDRFKEYYEG